MSNYTLEVISHHPKFESKTLRKYYVDGIDTVGAWGDEPFEIRFRNNTWQKVQVKLSVDGTDILTGKPADTQVSKDMWVVNSYGTLSLKAWPETNNGGAAFVFTSANNSVAVHTHGDLSSRGIIAAAVFVEGHVEPVRFTFPSTEHHHHYHYHDTYKGIVTTQPIWIYNNSNSTGGTLGGSGGVGGTYTSNSISNIGENSCSFNASDGVTAYNSVAPAAAAEPRARRSKSLESLVAVGAGQHVDQKITYVTGLTKPTFAETVRVKYMWWDELVESLRAHNAPVPHPSGFPGDGNKTNINLGCTPRIGGNYAFPKEAAQPVYTRF